MPVIEPDSYRYDGEEGVLDCIGAPVSMAGPVGVIQAITDCPHDGHPMHGIGVICHPHPLHGGILHNKVVATLSRTLNALGVGTVRFNFRGVGTSEGEYAEGIR